MIIAQLNARWRVVDDGGRQWVLARLDDKYGWVQHVACRTRAALLNCIGGYVTGDVDPAAFAIVAALPGHISRCNHYVAGG
jgi:hypothetical protein